MNEEDNWNSYFYKGTNILKNNFDIMDKEKLSEVEYKIVTKKNTLLILDKHKPQTFDINHLKYIHKYLFEDIYAFAGQFRTVNMGKGFMYNFTPFDKIELSLSEILDNIDKNILEKSRSDMLYAENLAKTYKRLIEIHPFREGNGRVAREFIREYVESRNKYFDYDYYIDFNLNDEDKITLEHVPREELYGNLTLVFLNMLNKKEKENQNNVKQM